MIRRHPLIALAVAAAATAAPLHAQNGGLTATYRAAADSLIRAATGDSAAYERLARLVDGFGHRPAGSRSLEAAIDWILSEMKKDGLQNVRGEPVQVTHWVRGAESAVLLHLGPGLADQPTDLGPLVSAQVVHHDDVAGAQRRHQAVLDVGLERRGVGGPVEGQAAGHAVESHRRGQGHGLPVALRDAADDPPAPRGAAVAAGHGGVRPGLVHEGQSTRVDRGELLTPGLALGLQLRAVLLGGLLRLFF